LILTFQSRLGRSEPDTFDLYVIGGLLHDLYHGAESICARIIKEIDRRELQGANWHRELLDWAGTELTDVRPAVIKAETLSLLEQYRKFRHRFRGIYGFELEWNAMKPLFEGAVSTMDVFVRDLEQFITFLQMVASDHDSHVT
jgi:hypothetical protein